MTSNVVIVLRDCDLGPARLLFLIRVAPLP